MAGLSPGARTEVFAATETHRVIRDYVTGDFHG